MVLFIFFGIALQSKKVGLPHAVEEAPRKKGKEKKSLLASVEFEDFAILSGSRFNFRISKIQQEALNRASGHLPHPSKQLELAAAQRKKKHRGRAQHERNW